MKNFTLTLLCLVTFCISYAQQKAVTETGEEVILFIDGTWRFQNEEDLKETQIPTNGKEFTKDKNSTFQIKSSKFNVGFWINPKKWSFEKAVNNPEAEYELELKGGDLYSMIISEKIEIPLTTLKTIALENAKASAPDIKIVNEEYRIVNGLKVLHLQMNGTLQGIKFSYFGYYFSNENGTLQYVTYTSQDLLESYIDDCEELLNGIVELEKE